MPIVVARIVIGVIGAYVLLGIVAMPAFWMRGLRRIDPLAAQGSIGFRFMIAPGLVLFWPLVLARWRSARRTNPDALNRHTPDLMLHLWFWVILTPILALALCLALLNR